MLFVAEFADIGTDFREHRYACHYVNAVDPRQIDSEDAMKFLLCVEVHLLVPQGLLRCRVLLLIRRPTR